MILADTGFFVALIVATDRHHQRALDAASQFAGEGLLTTWPVLTETVHLVQRKLGSHVAKKLLGSMADGAATIFDLSPRHLPRVLELMNKYQNLPMDLADASLVICAEETDDGRILSTDTRDFGAYRWKNRKPFKNLLHLSMTKTS